MADINVNVVLPDPISVDVTSPTQALATNVSVPGPQGPAGPRGFTPLINGITGDSILFSGQDGVIISSDQSVNTIYVSGNSGYFQSAVNSLTTNLQSTGSNLYTLLTNFSGNLDATYATDLQLYNTGSTLDNKINSLSGYSASINNLETTGSTLNSKINSLSGWSASAIDLTSTGIILINNLFNTGSTLDTKINDLSGYVNIQDTNISTNLTLTGSILNSKINSLSGYTDSQDTIISNNLITTGSTLDNKINILSGVSVLTYGNQVITGIKDFINRPTVNTIPVLLSGENANGLSVLVKNDDSVTLQKGQPVYIYGANGNNILVRIARNSEEATSSKTLGLLSQTLAPNDQGYVITEGSLEGIDTNAGNAGDPIWLGPTGNLIFGLVNKPYAPNNLVYLGVIERKQSNNGKIYVKIQNGFELEELHNVNINHTYNLSDGDVIRYNSVSGLWFNQPLDTGSIKTTIQNTGSILDNKINSLSGWSASAIDLTSTGSVLDLKINNLSGYVNTQDNTISINLYNTGNNLNNRINSLSGYTDSQDITISNNLRTTGSTLDTKINNLSGYVNTQDTTISNNLITTGSTLDNKINSLSGSSVLLYGNQSIGGIKTFRDNVYINNLFVTGTETIVSTNNFNVQSPYILLNLTGGAVDGGIFFVTGSGFTGIDSYGPIIGFDHSDKFKFGISTRNSDLSTLPDIASVQELRAYSGVANNTFSTITNLYNTGSTLDNKINNLSGSTVLLYGNQTINGAKTFTNSINIQPSQDPLVIESINDDLAFIRVKRTNGTITSKTAVTNGDYLGGIRFFGASGNNFNPNASADIACIAGQNFNSTQRAGYIQFRTISTDNETNLVERLRIANNGYTRITSSGNFSAAGTDQHEIYQGSPTATNAAVVITHTATAGNNKWISFRTGQGATSERASISYNRTTNRIDLNGQIGGQTGTFTRFFADNLIYNTGNQTISGIKIFDLAPIVSGNPLITGNLSDYATIINLALTGSTLDGKINSLSGWSASAINLFNTGSALDSKINSLSGNLTSNYATITNLASTGSTLNTKINSLSGSAVLLYGNQNINGDKIFLGDTTLTGNNNRIGKYHHIQTDQDFVFIRGANDSFIFSSEEFLLQDLNGGPSVYFNDRRLQDSINGYSIDWENRQLYNKNNVDVLTWTGDNIGIGTSTPSEKLEVNGNVKFGDVINGYSAKFMMYDAANAVYNTGEWSDGQLILSCAGYATNKYIILNFQEDTNHIQSNGSILRLPSGKDDFIAMDSEVVHKTGNETIYGVKTFIGNHIISGNTTISGSINISGNYDIYSQIENVKKLAIAYAIAL